MKKISLLTIVFAAICILISTVSCNSGNESAWIEEHGYGPVTEPLELAEADDDIIQKGEQIFARYCEACHTINAAISGPAMNRVVQRRPAEFFINYTLNPRENRQNHPIGREIAEQYPGIMGDTGISLEEAIAVYQYVKKSVE